MALNPMHLLMDRLMHMPMSLLIQMAETNTCRTFEDKCVSVAKDDEPLNEVRTMATVAFKWWNSEY